MLNSLNGYSNFGFRLPEYCFDGNETSHLQPIKNSSWKTTSAAELLYYMFQCYDSRVRVENIKGTT